MQPVRRDASVPRPASGEDQAAEPKVQHPPAIFRSDPFHRTKYLEE
ncbi:MAG: hypothetical protein PHO60_04055 [Methanothrix sp.]|nr:hypothetical protein [Methanothrix sp.]